MCLHKIYPILNSKIGAIMYGECFRCRNVADNLMNGMVGKSPWESNRAPEDEDDRVSKKSARCLRFRWLLKFVVFPPFASTIFLHKRHMASSEFKGRPFSSAFKPKYNHTVDLLLGLLTRSMLTGLWVPRWMQHSFDSLADLITHLKKKKKRKEKTLFFLLWILFFFIGVWRQCLFFCCITAIVWSG